MNLPWSEEATLVACLTPPGAGAIATLALRGSRAWTVIRELFSPATVKSKLPDRPEPGPFWLGRLGEEARASAAEEVVLAVQRTTPVPWVELHCHGGREAIRFLLEIFAGHGVQVCSWQQLECLTTTDPGQAEALAALVEARTARTAAILLDQYHGAFARAVAEVRTALQENQPATAASRLHELLRYAALGRHLTVPWRVVIAGAPNVGKSSLVNALAGYQRSVVAATPGTTRDVVTTLIAVDGWPVELADTAGLRREAAPVEQRGIDRAQAAVADADLCLWVVDASVTPVWPSVAAPSLRLVINKSDLPAASGFVPPAGAVAVSARTGAGLEELCQALARWVVPDSPPPGAAMPFTASLAERVAEAQRCCSAGRPAEALQTLQDLWK